MKFHDLQITRGSPAELDTQHIIAKELGFGKSSELTSQIEEPYEILHAFA